MDMFWLNAVLSCIGENYDAEVADSICGCSVAIRKAQLRISLWIGTCEQKTVSVIVFTYVT